MYQRTGIEWVRAEVIKKKLKDKPDVVKALMPVIAMGTAAMYESNRRIYDSVRNTALEYLAVKDNFEIFTKKKRKFGKIKYWLRKRFRA